MRAIDALSLVSSAPITGSALLGYQGPLLFPPSSFFSSFSFRPLYPLLQFLPSFIDPAHGSFLPSFSRVLIFFFFVLMPALLFSIQRIRLPEVPRQCPPFLPPCVHQTPPFFPCVFALTLVPVFFYLGDDRILPLFHGWCFLGMLAPPHFLPKASIDLSCHFFPPPDTGQPVPVAD